MKEKWGVGGASIRWELPQSSAYTQRLTCICSHFFLPSCGNRNSHFLDMSFPYHLSEYLLLLSIDSFSLAFQNLSTKSRESQVTHIRLLPRQKTRALSLESSFFLWFLWLLHPPKPCQNLCTLCELLLGLIQPSVPSFHFLSIYIECPLIRSLVIDACG